MGGSPRTIRLLRELRREATQPCRHFARYNDDMVAMRRYRRILTPPRGIFFLRDGIRQRIGVPPACRQRSASAQRGLLHRASLPNNRGETNAHWLAAKAY